MNEEIIRPSMKDVLTPFDTAVVDYFEDQVIKAAEHSATFAKTIFQLMAIIIPGYTAAISFVFDKEPTPGGMFWAVPLWVLSLTFSVLAVIPIKLNIINNPDLIKKKIQRTAQFRWWVGVLACVFLVAGAVSITISVWLKGF